MSINTLQLYSTSIGVFFKECYNLDIKRKGFLSVKSATVSQTKETISREQFIDVCKELLRGKQEKVRALTGREVQDI